MTSPTDQSAWRNGVDWLLDSSRTITWAIADNAKYTWADPPLTATVISAAFAAWESVANIDFQYVGPTLNVFNTSADITFSIGDSALFGSASTEAATFFPSTQVTDRMLAAYGRTRSAYPFADGDIWVNNDFGPQAALHHNPGSQVFYAVLHEIGHALGLKHPFDDGGTGHPTFTQDGFSQFDTPYETVMS